MMKHTKTQLKFSLILGVILLLLAVGQKAFGQDCKFEKIVDEFEGTTRYESEIHPFEFDEKANGFGWQFIVGQINALYFYRDYPEAEFYTIGEDVKLQLKLANDKIITLNSLVETATIIDDENGDKTVYSLYGLNKSNLNDLSSSKVVLIRMYTDDTFFDLKPINEGGISRFLFDSECAYNFIDK